MEKTPKEYFVKVDVKDEKSSEIKCPRCNGDGHTSEHNDNSINYESGEHDCSLCPIQVQCEYCMGTGNIFLKPLPSMPEQEWVSDAEIEKEFPIEKNNEAIVNHYNLHSQIGAKWMRDKLLNK